MKNLRNAQLTAGKLITLLQDYDPKKPVILERLDGQESTTFIGGVHELEDRVAIVPAEKEVYGTPEKEKK